MSNPTPLLPHTVQLLLQFILPPSQLDRPLPPHLISKPLLQRHHFLQLLPENPEEYLCWPSDNRAHIIQLLESHPTPCDDEPYPVRYTADLESTYAHVHITSHDETGLRMIFQWDAEQDAWTYHGFALMPFPPASSSLLFDLAPPSQNDFLPHHDVNDDDDGYWDAYGQDDEPLRSAGLSAAKDASPATEDAYWAQYATVQGSGDSTLPSPLPIQRRKLPPTGLSFESESDIAALVRPHSLLDGPSPNTLTRRLYAASPRRSHPSSPPALDYFPETPSDSPSPPPGLAKIALALASAPASQGSVLKPAVNTAASPVVVSVDKPVEPGSDARASENEALEMTIRGLYKIWKDSRPFTKDSTLDTERNLFVSIVKDAVASV